MASACKFFVLSHIFVTNGTITLIGISIPATPQRAIVLSPLALCFLHLEFPSGKRRKFASSSNSFSKHLVELIGVSRLKRRRGL